MKFKDIVLIRLYVDIFMDCFFPDRKQNNREIREAVAGQFWDKIS